MGTPKGTIPWNAGTGKGWICPRGYRQIKVGKRNVREHRYIMEQYLGRRLEPTEVVHHRNGDKQDNRLENLELTSVSEHTIIHNTGSKRSDSTKKSISVFRQLSAELKRLQAINTELYAALDDAFKLLDGWQGRPEWRQGIIDNARAALAKARGGK